MADGNQPPRSTVFNHVFEDAANISELGDERDFFEMAIAVAYSQNIGTIDTETGYTQGAGHLNKKASWPNSIRREVPVHKDNRATILPAARLVHHPAYHPVRSFYLKVMFGHAGSLRVNSNGLSKVLPRVGISHRTAQT
jgi:hypothetical protein